MSNFSLQTCLFRDLTLYVPEGGGQICPTFHEFLNFLISLKHMLRLVDFSCMSITVPLQKTRASYVPRFNFGGLFFDKKSYFQIANFQFLPKMQIFPKALRATFFELDGCAFKF